MINEGKIERYSVVQGLAKETMVELLAFIRHGVTERDIAEKAKAIFKQKGIHEFWYYGIAALVLMGERTTLSVSGREYAPADTPLKADDLVTIDLSPVSGGIWGDYARAVYIEDGSASFMPLGGGFKEGFEMEMALHQRLLDQTTPEMTAHELWRNMNEMIAAHGFKNLDFKGNLGHSIERELGARHYIEEGNFMPLKDFGFFTFEPHIQKSGGPWGFKHENIHYFSGGNLKVL